jgi:hypothetical protein
MSQYRNDSEIQKIQRIFDEAKKAGYLVKIGEGSTAVSMSIYCIFGGKDYKPITFWESGSIEFLLEYLMYRPGFEEEDQRKEILNKINSLSGVSFSDDYINRRPSIKLEILDINDNYQIFIEFVAWFIKKVKKDSDN